METKVTDFFGQEIKIGDEVILAGLKRFKKRTVVSIKEREEYGRMVTFIGVKSSPSSRVGYTYPGRLIVKNK